MNYSSSLINKIIEAAENDAFFKDVRLMHAYSKAVKPTLLKTAAVAFSCRKINLQSPALGGCADAGDTEISANIYVPYINNEITGEEIAKRLCSVIFSVLNVTAVNIAASAADAETECIVTKTAFSFNGQLEQGVTDYE